MHRRVWGPVAVVVALLLGAGTLPRLDLRTWSTPVTGKPWLAPPSWPVPALRDHRFAWAGLERSMVMPSWPVPALRHVRATVVGSLPRVSFAWARLPQHETPSSAPIAFASQQRWIRAGLSTWFAALLAYAATWLPRARAARRGRRVVGMASRVRVLAERGIDAGQIAQHAGLPRDAVRGLMRASAVRRRA